METDKDTQTRARAYAIWEAEGRPEGRNDEHWSRAEQDGTAANDPHPGMMGDGTEEQNLGQTGNPGARITEAEVAEAFKPAPAAAPAAAAAPAKGK